MAAKFPSSSPKKNIKQTKNSDKHDPILSKLKVKVVKATQVGTLIKPKTKEPKTTPKTKKASL